MQAVLRLTPGDTVIASDGRGREFTVRLEALGEHATGTIVGAATTRREAPLAISLVQGIPKGDKMETIVRAVTELGAVRVLPAITQRTVVRLEPSRWRERARRWQRIAKEAAKQSGRAVVPDVALPRPLLEWLEPTPTDADLRLCLWEGEAPAISRVLDALSTPPATALVLVGPEGGLAREEVQAAQRHGWMPVSLGSRILRTETAALAVVTILQFRFSDLGRDPA